MYLTGILSIFAVYVAWTVCTAVFVSTHSEVAAKLSLFWIYAYSPAYNLCFNGIDISAKELRRLSPELEDGDATSTLSKRKDLDQVGYCKMSILSVCF